MEFKKGIAHICFALSFLLVYWANGRAYGGELKAELVFSNDRNVNMTSNLVFEEEFPEVSDGKDRVVVLRGKFDRPGWGLVYDKRWLVTRTGSSEGQTTFKIPILLTGTSTPITLFAYGSSHESETIQFSIRAIEDSKDLIPDRHISTFLGYTLISYLETNVPAITESTLTLKGVWVEPIAPLWDLRFSGYYNFLPLSTVPSGDQIEFLGLNAVIGYRPPLPYLWKLSLMFGGYFTAMFGGNGAYGYNPLIYPEFFPALTYSYRPGQTLMGYLKYVPMSFPITQNFELSGGVSWSKQIEGTHSLIFAIDTTGFSYPATSYSRIQVSTLSFSVGYGF